MVTVAEEFPFAAVVDTECLSTSCSSCFSTKGNKSRCIGCKVVSYCNKACQMNDWIDHKRECSFLNNYSPNVPCGRSRLMARIAMKLKRPDAKKPAFNGRVYDDLMDHRDEIVKEKRSELCFYTHILRDYMGKYMPNPDIFSSIYGKVVTNAYGIMNNGQTGQGLYVGLSAHDHSCIPNSAITSVGCKTILRTSDPNKKYSKDLTVTYTELLLPNRDRMQLLRAQHYFTCTCVRCSDPTLDFLYNSACSTCCPDSYCLLNPDAKELACNKCGTISTITVKEAVVANEEVKLFCNNSNKERSNLLPDLTFDVPTLIEAYEKYAKILSPLNLNLLMLNDRLVMVACVPKNVNPVTRKYTEYLRPAHKRYWDIGFMRFPEHLRLLAMTKAHDYPPTEETLEVIKEALAAVLVWDGEEHERTVNVRHLLSLYQMRIESFTSRGIDLPLVEA